MRSRVALFVLLTTALVFALLVGRQMYVHRDRVRPVEKRLRVLTYASFVGTTGPGAEILAQFEKDNDCKVDVISVADAGLLLQRLKLGRESVDVVLGLDQLLEGEARAQFAWADIHEDRSQWAEPARAHSDAQFSAYDWSPLTFLYRRSQTSAPPTNLAGLTSAGWSKQFAVQDPRASTPGLQFYQWIRALKGPDTAAWLLQFKPNVHSVSPSWSFAYGLFRKKQAQFVFTYLTSLAFHWGDEKDQDVQPLIFPEGHPVQVELAAIPATCQSCDLAQSFVRALHTPWAQERLMRKNYMLPVLSDVAKDTLFAQLPRLKTIATPEGRDLSDWDKVFGR